MQRPLDIVVVGGGTAGWMTAAALVSVAGPKAARVRLVESDEIGIVGVGEATLPQIRDYNDVVGVIEADMMRKTNATFKLGIEFRDWGYRGSSYVHPFGAHGRSIGGAAFHHHWTRARLAGHAFDLQDFSYCIEACRQNRFEYPAADPSAVNAAYSYAYHFDASLYARFLRGFSEARGLQRVEGKIVRVDQHPERGDVRAVVLESGEEVAGDLFIDCSGFRALLIGQTLDGGWEDWTRWLPCDRALAVPCELGGDFTPYTRSTAREAGWQWRIPLQHRIGNGYVYSSAHISDDDAAATLLANLDGKALDDPRPLRFRAGRRTESWKKNVVGIGLASGFLEPLESTSIYLVQIAIQHLLKLFPRRPVDPALAAEFNRLIDLEYDRVRDFLILHYHLNRRDDAELWRYCRATDVPDTLREKLELFAHRGHIDVYKDGLFAPPSWLSVYVGQGLEPRGYDRLADGVPLDVALAEMNDLRTRIRDRVARMPTHDAFIRTFAGSASRKTAPLGAVA